MTTQTITCAPSIASPDDAIQLTERFDKDTADWLMKEDILSKEDKKKLRAYLKHKHTGNCVDITYVFGKKVREANEDIGRVYSVQGIGLQTFPRELRNALARKDYWDIDFVNCQPTLLVQLCERNKMACPNLKRYCENRKELLEEVMVRKECDYDEAKTWILKAINQGNIDGSPEFCFEIKREARAFANELLVNPPRSMTGVKENRQAKILSLTLQEEEKKCMRVLMKALRERGRRLEVIIHDGGLVRQLENESCIPSSLLRECENEIYKETGYKLTLLQKPMETSLVRPDHYEDQFVPNTIQVDDTYAARKFVEIMGEYIVKDEKTIHIFDDTTGMWSDDELLIRSKITQCGEKLIFKQLTPTSEKVFNYSGIVKNTNNLITKLPDVLPSQDGYFMSRISSDKDKLLFKNGIYDFETGVFTEGFDSKIIFRHSCPRDFPTYKDQDKVNSIRHTLFLEPFREKEDGKRLSHNLMRAMIGDWRRKKMVLGLGPKNTGKSLLTMLSKTAFGSFVENFEANSLLMKHGSEANREFLWAAGLVDKRLVFSSEIKTTDDKNTHIDGGGLKKLTGGSDTISFRKMFQTYPTIKFFRPLMICLSQDFPTITPCDDAMLSRIDAFNYDYSFVANPVKSWEKQRDDSLGEYYTQDSYGDAFFWLLVEEYQEWKENGYAELPEATNSIKEDMTNEVDVENIILQDYEITRNPDDSVSRAEIQTYLKRFGVSGSQNKITREMKQLGCEPGYVVRNRVKNYVYKGIKSIET